MNKDIDFINITTEDGKTELAELVTKFKIEGLGEYVIYKLNGLFYGAKYDFDGVNTKLITDLSDNEKNILNSILNGMEMELA